MALDATLYMAEETSQPKKDIPKAVIATVLIGFFYRIYICCRHMLQLSEYARCPAVAVRPVPSLFPC